MAIRGGINRRTGLGVASRALALCVAVVACGDGQVEPPGPTVIGTWVLEDAALALEDSGRLVVSLTGTAGLAVPDVVAAYATEGTTLSIVDSSGIQSCGVGIVGRYTFQVNATTLSLNVLSDGCSGRTSFLTAGTWSRE